MRACEGRSRARAEFDLPRYRAAMGDALGADVPLKLADDRSDEVALYLLRHRDEALPAPMVGKWSDGPCNFMGQAVEVLAPATHYRHIVLLDGLPAPALRPGRLRAEVRRP